MTEARTEGRVMDLFENAMTVERVEVLPVPVPEAQRCWVLTLTTPARRLRVFLLAESVTAEGVPRTGQAILVTLRGYPHGADSCHMLDTYLMLTD